MNHLILNCGMKKDGMNFEDKCLMISKSYLKLQAPVTVLQNSQNKGDNKDLLFLSHGLYERVFNDNTQFEDMLCSMYLLSLLAESTSHGDFSLLEAIGMLSAATSGTVDDESLQRRGVHPLLDGVCNPVRNVSYYIRKFILQYLADSKGLKIHE